MLSRFKLPVSDEAIQVISQLDQFRGSWAAGIRIPTDRLARLEEAARIQSAAASCRLAGIRVPETEVAALLRGEAVPVREGQEILGYAEAIARPLLAEGGLLTTEELRKLHAIMMGSKGGAVEPTPWRQQPLHLEAFDAEGRAMGRIFQTLPPRLVPEKTEDLLTWVELELRGREHHPLLVIAACYLVLMAISPFERGNGRLARLVAGRLLRRAGYGYAPYGSIEREIEEVRDEYYEAVDAAETRLWTDEADLTPWIRFFFEVLRRHGERVQAKIALEARALDLTPLQRQIVDILRDHGTARAGMLLAATGANRNTLKDNLRRLAGLGIVERLGEKRGAQYRLATGEPPPSRLTGKPEAGPARSMSPDRQE